MHLTIHRQIIDYQMQETSHHLRIALYQLTKELCAGSTRGIQSTTDSHNSDIHFDMNILYKELLLIL